MTGIPPSVRIALTLCFMALLVFVSLFPARPGEGGSVLNRLIAKTPAQVHKLLHVCFYAVLALLLVWVLEGMHPENFRYPAALIIAVAFGALMEWCQTGVPGRYGTVQDVALNAAGAALGMLVAFILL